MVRSLWASLANGNIVTGSSGDQKIYVFADTDGQTLGTALASSPYGCQTSNCNYAMASSAGVVYGAQLFGGIYEKIAADGSRAPMTGAVAGLRGYLGMWTNPANGHLVAASNVGLVEIDPISGSFRVINGSLFPDGVSVSADGLTAYVENGGTVQAYSIATGALLHTYSTGHGPDGTGVIYGGLFNGQIVVNNNDGTVGLLDPVTEMLSIIASGGTRGDFVSPDYSNGTLFLSQFEQVARLSCGVGCSIGGPGPSVAEPGSLALAGIALMAVFGLPGAIRRRTPGSAGV